MENLEIKKKKQHKNPTDKTTSEVKKNNQINNKKHFSISI